MKYQKVQSKIFKVLPSTYVTNRISEQSPEMFYKKVNLKNLSKFTGKDLCQRLFFNKVAGLKQIYADLYFQNMKDIQIWCRYIFSNFAHDLLGHG